MITILIIIYLLYSIYNLKAYLKDIKIRGQDALKKIAIFNLRGQPSLDKIGPIADNIVDFQLKNTDKETENKNPYKISNPIKIKNQENKEISFLVEVKEKTYYKTQIRNRINDKIDDIDLELIYSNKESYKYTNIFNIYQTLYDVLILIRTKDGRKLGIFTNNIVLYDTDIVDDTNDYTGYIYNYDIIYEIELNDFLKKYGNYLQNIFDFIKGESYGVKSKNIKSTTELLGDIELFEIYYVKYIRY